MTKYGQCIRFNERDVRSTGRTSMGVIGMNLTDGDKVVGMQMESQGDALMIVSEKVLENAHLHLNLLPRTVVVKVSSAIRSQKNRKYRRCESS